MDFSWSARNEELRSLTRRITEEVVAPRAAEIDAAGEYPHDIFDTFKEAGLLGLSIDPQYGGTGDGTLGLAIAVEEMARACCNSGLLLLMARLSTVHIAIAGTEEQKRRYLGGVARGEMKGAFALTEPEVGSDSGHIGTAAARDGDAYILNGTKRWAGQATVADYVIVAARTGEGSREIGVFIVPTDNPGFRIVRTMPKMGVNAVPVVEIALEECRIPVGNRVGPEQGGFRVLLQGLSLVRPIVAARGLGLAAGILQYATEYARARRSMGKPIIEHQAVSFKLAERAMELEAARLLTHRAAWLIDQGKTTPADATHYSMAKAYATEMAVRAADTALQTLGGNGYLKEYPTERFYRDARQLMLVEGTSEIQRLIIARAIEVGDYQW